MAMETALLDDLQISTTYMRVLAREHSDPQGVLEPLGVVEGPGTDSDTTPLTNFFDLVRVVDAYKSEPDWHLDYARRTSDNFHGPLTFAMMSASTIGDGLEAIARYVSIRAPYFRSVNHRTGHDLTIEIEELVDLGNLRHLLVEISFRVLHDYVAMIGDVNMAAAKLSLKYPASPDRQYYEQGFDCPVLFDQERNALTMPAAWMAIPNPQYDEGTWSNAITRCELALSKLGPSDIVARTRAYINATLVRDPQNLCINDAARFLGMSTRTLIRKLGNSGTRFQTLRDNARQDLALRLLRRPNLTVERVAVAVGFSDAANFSRAFKRWFDTSPRRYRRERTNLNL